MAMPFAALDLQIPPMIIFDNASRSDHLCINEGGGLQALRTNINSSLRWLGAYIFGVPPMNIVFDSLRLAPMKATVSRLRTVISEGDTKVAIMCV